MNKTLVEDTENNSTLEEDDILSTTSHGSDITTSTAINCNGKNRYRFDHSMYDCLG
jgi:hypothetical protein